MHTHIHTQLYIDIYGKGKHWDKIIIYVTLPIYNTSRLLRHCTCSHKLGTIIYDVMWTVSSLAYFSKTLKFDFDCRIEIFRSLQ